MTLLSVLVLSALVAPQSPEEVLSKVSSALASLKSVKYEYKRILDYPGEKFHHEMKGTSYLDFASPLRFRFEASSGFVVFNGAELITANRKDKTLKLDYGSPDRHIDSASFLKNSYQTLRNSLPRVLPGARATLGPSQGDTLTVILESPKKVLENGTAPSDNAMDARYEIVVRRSDYLPLSVTQRYGDEGNSIRAEFSDIRLNPAAPEPKSWIYSTYLPEYTLTKDEEIKTIEAGRIAPEWTLPTHGAKTLRSMKDLRGKLVLLDFWITQCTPCIASVPKLNAIGEKYKGQPFALVAVNASDRDAQIDAFRKRNGVKYETLWQGAKVAKSYGIASFPTVVLVDKNGVVLYSGSFVAEEIEKLIAAHL